MTKKQREQRAVEAIVAGVLRGFTKRDWQKVFARMDKIEKQRVKEWDAACRVDPAKLHEPFTI